MAPAYGNFLYGVVYCLHKNLCVCVPAYLYYLLYRVSTGSSLFASKVSSIATGSHHNLCCNALSCLSLSTPSAPQLLYVSVLFAFHLFVCLFSVLGLPECSRCGADRAITRCTLISFAWFFGLTHSHTHSHTVTHTLTHSYTIQNVRV